MMNLTQTPAAPGPTPAAEASRPAVAHGFAPAKSPQLKSGAHIPALDGLRGLAILLVLVFHFTQVEKGSTGLQWVHQRACAMGWVGVDLFFVLSGFLITGILVEAKQAAGYFKNFYMRRVLRIFPLYYGLLAVTFLVLPFFVPLKDDDIRDVYRNQGWLWAYLQNWVQLKWGWMYFTHFWSLAVEEQFYLVWPAVVFLLPRRALMGACLAMILASIGVRVWRVAGYSHLAPADVFKAAEFTYYNTLCRMDGLAIGALIALAARGPGGIVRLAKPALVTLSLSAVGLAGLLLLNKGSFFYGDPRVQLAGFTLLAVFFGSVLVRTVLTDRTSLWGRFCSSGFMRFFGKYSYGIYVFHGLLVPLLASRWLMNPLMAKLHSYYAAWAVQVLLMSLVSIGVALVSWHLYEKHFLKLKRFFEYRKDATTTRPV